MLTEAAVRAALRNSVRSNASTPAGTAYEFWVPRTHERADMVLIGESLEGFEIKTERDTLKRLPRQASAYARVFDRCHAVLASCHLEAGLKVLPQWWGVSVIEQHDRLSFRSVREADQNDLVEPETIVRLLWRDEVYSALCEVGAPPEPTTGRTTMWNRLLTVLDLEQLRQVVRTALLHRDPSKARIPTRRFSEA